VGSSISDDVDTSGEVTLTEESEESGEGLGGASRRRERERATMGREGGKERQLRP